MAYLDVELLDDFQEHLVGEDGAGWHPGCALLMEDCDGWGLHAEEGLLSGGRVERDRLGGCDGFEEGGVRLAGLEEERPFASGVFPGRPGGASAGSCREELALDGFEEELADLLGYPGGGLFQAAVGFLAEGCEEFQAVVLYCDHVSCRSKSS